MKRRNPFLLLSVIILFGGLAASANQFMQAPQYTVGPSPLAAAAGDLNGDGKMDLVVTNKVDSTISVLINNGNGTFKTQVAYDVGGSPASVSLADLNGDGHLDIVVPLPIINDTPGTRISVLMGKGDGTFQKYVQYYTGSVPQYVAVQDLNGDGKPDIVVANAGGTTTPANNISVLLNNGSGGFGTAKSYTTGFGPLAVAIGDFNNDHFMDIAVANSCGNSATCALASPGTVSILLGDGTGNFLPTLNSLTVGYRPDGIIAVDLNGDGYIDLATSNFNGSDVSVLMGNGNGTFKNQVSYQTAYWSPNGIVAGDFNKDGKLDLAVSINDSTAVSILLGNGNGTFQAHQDYWAGNGGGILAAADFNGDSNLDLAVPDLGWATRADIKVTVLMGNGDGTFRSHMHYDTGATPGALATADFNGDGILDVVVGEDLSVPFTPTCGCAKISVLISNGHGGYLPAVDYPTGVFPASVAVGDFNKDGFVDIAAANYGTSTAPENSVSVLLGNGDGTFQPEVRYNVGNNPLALTAADVNGDGKIDLIVSDTGGSSPDLGVLLGNGDGSFQSEKTVSVSGAAKAIAVADLNGDGHLDLVALLPNSKKVATLLGNGDGTFKAPVQFNTGSGPLSIAVGDLNGDHRIDVAVVNNTDAAVGVMLGNGDGTLKAQVPYNTPTDPTGVVVGDFNGDSKMDLLVASRYDNSGSLFLGKGDGTMLTPVAYGLGWQPTVLSAADLNGDGALDVVSANTGVRSISLIMNGRGTLISVASSIPNPLYGDAVTLTASVSASISWNSAAPSGTVNFLDGSNVLGTGTLSGGKATFTTSTLSSGTHNLTAAYLGDVNFQPHASSAIQVTVTGSPDFAVTVASFPGPVQSGQSVTSTVTITPANGFTGSVALSCTSGMPAKATCTFNPATVTPGSGPATSVLTITTDPTTHGGDYSLSVTGTSGTTTHVFSTLVLQLSDFNISAAAPAAIKAGQSATSTITLAPVNGFNAPVTFSCASGLPAKSTCTFNPATLTPTASGATSTLTIATTASSSAKLQSSLFRNNSSYAMWLPFSLLMMTGLGFGSINSRKLKVLTFLLGGLLVLCLVFLSGCGGGSSSTTPVNPATPGTPAGAYTITVNATSGSGSSAMVRTTTVTLTVQ